MSNFEILVVDDDDEVIRQLTALLPEKLDEFTLSYQFENDFDEAVKLLGRRRYDLLISDIYIGRDTVHKKPGDADVKARELVAVIRQLRACPIILITDGQLPEEFKHQPFVFPVDKGGTKFIDRLEEALRSCLSTGIPAIAKSIHEEIDRYAGSFLWGFLEKNWTRLSQQNGGLDRAGLERVIRRRAAFQLARLIDQDGAQAERQDADPCDYYIMPPIGAHLRLGEILHNQNDGAFRVVITPHCHLVVQPNQERPRAEYLLTLKTIPAGDHLAGKAWGNDSDKKLRTRSAIPSRDVGLPEERYCFLPGFLDVPDLYCDLMQSEAIPYAEVGRLWTRVAALDAPFAEALQASFARLFGAVGLPGLNIDRVRHLVVPTPGKSEG